MLLLIPVLIVNQEMCLRLGAVTGVGHARLILERFGKFWGAFSVGDLFILNFLTLITEFIGVSLAMSYFGISPFISVPVAAVALIAVTITGSFRRWERFMYGFIVVNLVAIPLTLMVHPDIGIVVHDSVVPSVRGGLDGTALLLIISIVGTTVAPWQLFFQQSNVIDKRITPRWINYERADTTIGAFVVVIAPAALMIAAAFGLAGTDLVGQFTDAGDVAAGLARAISPAAGDLFALFLLDAAIIGAAAVTLATSLAGGLGLLVALGLGTIGVLELREVRRSPDSLAGLTIDRASWRMPPLPELPRPEWSTGRKAAMLALRGYLVVAVLLLLVKVVQIALGH